MLKTLFESDLHFNINWTIFFPTKKKNHIFRQVLWQNFRNPASNSSVFCLAGLASPYFGKKSDMADLFGKIPIYQNIKKKSIIVNAYDSKDIGASQSCVRILKRSPWPQSQSQQKEDNMKPNIRKCAFCQHYLWIVIRSFIMLVIYIYQNLAIFKKKCSSLQKEFDSHFKRQFQIKVSVDAKWPWAPGSTFPFKQILIG